MLDICFWKFYHASHLTNKYTIYPSFARYVDVLVFLDGCLWTFWTFPYDLILSIIMAIVNDVEGYVYFQTIFYTVSALQLCFRAFANILRQISVAQSLVLFNILFQVRKDSKENKNLNSKQDLLIVLSH